VRTIPKAKSYAHTDPIFENLGILTFHDIHLLQLGLCMYSYQNRTLPVNFDCKFTQQSKIPTYIIRNAYAFCLSFRRSNKQYFVFISRVDSLTTEIVNSSSPASFKNSLKVFIRNKPRIMHFAYSDWFTQSWLSAHIP